MDCVLNLGADFGAECGMDHGIDRGVDHAMYCGVFRFVEFGILDSGLIVLWTVESIVG